MLIVDVWIMSTSFLECVQDATFLKQNRYDIKIQRPHTNYYQEYNLNLFYRIYDITGGQETSLVISVNKILSPSVNLVY